MRERDPIEAIPRATLEFIDHILPLHHHLPLHPFRVAVQIHVGIEADGLRDQFEERNV